MIILKQLERSLIVADDNNKIRVMYQNRLYDPETFECISDPDQKHLYPHLRKEVEENMEEAKKALPKRKTTKAEPTSTVGSELEQLLIKTIAAASVDKIVEAAKPQLNDYIIKTFGILPQVHEVKTPSGTHKVEGVTHEAFEKVLNLVNLNIPVFLSGAAGTGKNVICKQIAEGLGLDFYFTNAVTQEYQLKGFIDANGNFHETQFYKAFTNGGLFFLDEMDGSIPETLIILNAAIANGYFDFPTGKVEANPNFRVIAAGNTVGTGADIEYTGRFQLDASSLDRFALIEIDYSPAIEEAVTNGNYDLCNFARAFRKITNKTGIRCLFSYRSMERIAKLESIQMDLPEIIKISLTKGLGQDDLNIIVKEFEKRGFKNKYSDAMRKVWEASKAK
jgi:hypothetical protein